MFHDVGKHFEIKNLMYNIESSKNKLAAIDKMLNYCYFYNTNDSAATFSSRKEWQ